MMKHNNSNSRFSRKAKTTVGLALAAAVVLILLRVNGGGGKAQANLTTFAARRGTLIIDVLESGNVEASDSIVIKSKVEGRTAIISIVPEGSIITEEDVANKKVLVELDSSELRNRETEQVISVQGAEADYTDARESYAIQVNQNESNQKQGELKVKFAMMDLEKYLGDKLAGLFIEGQAQLDSLMASEDLGGEALQTRRELESEIKLVQEEKARAEDKLDWTRRLEEKGYVTRNDLQADELALKRQEVALEQAETALDLFRRYEFRKQAEQFRSDYEEAVKELERIIAKNRAELSKADARLKSASASYVRKAEELNRSREQIQSCRIVATKPGLVVYAGSDSPWRDTRIEEGAEVHENMEILKIPSSSSMVVKTKVHESVIARVKQGQRAAITIDAMPDRRFEGEVIKVGIVPDSQNRWWNPDLKVYLTEVSIEGSHPNLKPGMSAQVQIIVDEFDDVLMVPLEAVGTVAEERVCFVMSPSGPEMKAVETGDYNDKFIEIRGGLDEGQKVVLNPSGLLEASKRAQPKPGDMLARAAEVAGATADADR